MPPVDWKDRFLASLAQSPNVSAASLVAGISREAAYKNRDRDPEFAAAWETALEKSTDALVGEAYRRAFNGVEKPVYHKGVKVGIIREYSDTMLIFLLKCHRRAIYGDRYAADVTTNGETFKTVLYLPDNGRDSNTPGTNGQAATGAANGLHGDAG